MATTLRPHKSMTNAHRFAFSFDSSSRHWLPLCIHGRVKLWDPIAVDLKREFEIEDAPGYSWLRDGKIRIVPGSKKLIEARRAAQFELELSDRVSLEDILAVKQEVHIRLTLHPDRKAVAPGVPVAADVPPVSSICPIHLPFPAAIETELDYFGPAGDGKDGVYILARIQPWVPLTDSARLARYQKSLVFAQKSGQVVLEQPPRIDGQWRRVRAYPLPGMEHLAREQNNIVEISGRCENEDLVTRVIFEFEAGSISLSLRPGARLKLNGRDQVTLIAELDPASAQRLVAAELARLCASLGVSFDPDSGPWLANSAPSVSGASVQWVLTGAPGRSGKAPARSEIRVVGQLRGREIRAMTHLELEIDTSELEIFTRPEPPLSADGQQELWVYAKVKDRPQDPAFKAAEHTDRIDFDCKGVNADWLNLSDRSSQHGYRCVRVVAHSPAVGARLAAGAPLVAAAVVIEGRTVADSVPIALQRRPVMQAAINGKREAIVQYDRQRKAWLLPPITVQFVLPGDGNPVAVDCIFATPPARIAPALLKITRVERAGPQTVISVEVDTSKETQIAKYFRGSGSIQVTIVATAADGAARYEDSVAYRLVPAYELRVEQTTGVDPATLPRRAPKRNGVGPELDLAGWEFIADAHDELGLRVHYVRLDQPRDRREPAADLRINAISVIGVDAAHYECVADERLMKSVDRKPGEFYYRLRSRVPLLSTQARLDGRLALRIEAQLGKAAQSPATAEQDIQPLFLFLRLWVVPELRRGYSTAIARVAYQTAHPLVAASWPVELKVEPVAGREPQLEVVGDCQQQTLACGHAFWELKYAKVSWGNLEQARFSVSCRLADGIDAACFEIDLSANGAKLVAALNAAATITDRSDPLYFGPNNPVFTDPDSVFFRIYDYSIPDDCRGPIYDLVWWWYAIKCGILRTQIPDWMQHYQCSSMKDRLFQFVLRRRVDPKHAPDMNGIEFGDCQIGPHNFLGMNLSGNSITADPWFIDPWWRQSWDAGNVAVGWKGQYTKALATLTFFLCQIATLVLVIKAAGMALRHLRGKPPGSFPVVDPKGVLNGIAEIYRGARKALGDTLERERHAVEWIGIAGLFAGLIYFLKLSPMQSSRFLTENHDYNGAPVLSAAQCADYRKYITEAIDQEFERRFPDLPTSDTPEQPGGRALRSW